MFSVLTNPYGPIRTTVLKIKDGGLLQNEKPVELQHDSYSYWLRKGFSFKITHTLVGGIYAEIPDSYEDGTMRLERPLESYDLITTTEHLPANFNQVPFFVCLVNIVHVFIFLFIISLTVF